MPRFVTVRGGGYFFMPGISAVRYLACAEVATVEPSSRLLPLPLFNRRHGRPITNLGELVQRGPIAQPVRVGGRFDHQVGRVRRGALLEEYVRMSVLAMLGTSIGVPQGLSQLMSTRHGDGLSGYS